MDVPALSAQFVMEYHFKRSLGPVLSAFFTALRDGSFVGIRAADGRVLVPPCEYDPRTAAALSELVAVADRGVVTTYTWIAEPRPKHPLQRPFAFALIKLDGADTPLLHAVDAVDPDRMRTGLRVRAVWAEERVGAITDVLCFAPEAGA